MATLTPNRKRQFKDEIYGQFAAVGKALANGHRLEILDLVSQAEWSVESLAKETAMSVANTSRHLQLLRGAGLVRARRQGVRVYYRLASQAVPKLWRALRVFGETERHEIHQVVGAYLSDRAELAAIGVQELRRRLVAGDIVLLDVRPENEYASGHIPPAVSIPIADLEARLAELPTDKEIVAYCRGRYCVYSDEAVELLRRNGFRARRLEIGPQDWEVAS